MNRFFTKSLIVSLALVGCACWSASALAAETSQAKPAVNIEQNLVAASQADQQAQPTRASHKEAKQEAVSKYRHLKPFETTAPALTEMVKVRFKTSAGSIEMEIYPQAAPNAAKRFLELVKSGYYDNTPIFRVVKTPQPFVAQFGINWRDGHRQWNQKNFNDDPSLFHLEAGTLAFAKAGPNINSTQVFINYGNNDFLRQQTFSVFGIVTKGMEITHNFKQVGAPGMGLKPTMIIKAEIIKD